MHHSHLERKILASTSKYLVMMNCAGDLTLSVAVHQPHLLKSPCGEHDLFGLCGCKQVIGPLAADARDETKAKQLAA